MKKQLKAVKSARQAVEDIKSEIKVVSTSEYYEKFPRQKPMKAATLKELNNDLRDALNLEHSALERLKIALNLRLADINEELRYKEPSNI